MTNRLGLIAFFTGALWAQIYALQRDADHERRLRERDARDAVAVLDRARDELADADQLAERHQATLDGLRSIDAMLDEKNLGDSETARAVRGLLAADAPEAVT